MIFFSLSQGKVFFSPPQCKIEWEVPTSLTCSEKEMYILLAVDHTEL